VFGDDRVRGTRKQMTLQVVLVERRSRACAIWKNLWQRFIIFMSFKDLIIRIIELGFVMRLILIMYCVYKNWI